MLIQSTNIIIKCILLFYTFSYFCMNTTTIDNNAIFSLYLKTLVDVLILLI